MKSRRGTPLGLSDDALSAIGGELTMFLSDYIEQAAAASHIHSSITNLEAIFRTHSPACRSAILTTYGDHQLNIYSKEKVLALVFSLAMNCGSDDASELTFGDKDDKLYDALLSSQYIIMSSTSTVFSLSKTFDGSTTFYHVCLTTNIATADSFSYPPAMIATLSKWYQSSSNALSFYCLLRRMAFNSCKISYYNRNIDVQGLQAHTWSSGHSRTSSRLFTEPLPNELLCLQRHLHLLTFYFIKFAAGSHLRIRTSGKGKGPILLSLLASLAKRISTLQKEEETQPACIVTDWKTCSLIQGQTAIKMGVPKTGGIYFASYGFGGLIPFNDKGGRFLVFLLSMQESVLSLLSTLQINFSCGREYLSTLVGHWRDAGTEDSVAHFDFKTPTRLSFSMVVASSTISSLPSSLQTTPIQNHYKDVTDMQIPHP